jgi:hypothetical protein
MKANHENFEEKVVVEWFKFYMEVL